MVFDYNIQPRFTSQLQVDDIGHVALRCISPTGVVYYMVIETIMGRTAIIKAGPILDDCPHLVEKFNMSYITMKYNEAHIAKEITRYINNPMAGITDIEEVSIQEAIAALPSGDVYLNSIS